MNFSIQSPKLALKSFYKLRPTRGEIDAFKTNLTALLDKLNLIENRASDETEEHLKNDLRDFLRDTFYKETNAINTKDKKDLVLHLGKTTDSEVGVIIEAKRPSNTNEMLVLDNPNRKALHELVLYYLNERKQSANFQLKQLIITNIYEWYIIDANFFDKYIYENVQISKLYETKLNDKKSNPFFYEELSKIFEKIELEIPCVYFDIRKYESILRAESTDNDIELSALLRIFSHEYLLKTPNLNDSNSLNEGFYRELLHILGLEEVKSDGKNIIRRKSANRNPGSFIEMAIDAILTEDILHRLPEPKEYGDSKEERAFNASLELCISWINRVLFLKLLEGQLVGYHHGDKSFNFLNTSTIISLDELFKLFHKVLAIEIDKRSEPLKSKYSRIPYLNSSLFEISDLEDKLIKINGLDNDAELELYGTTILKETKKHYNKLPTLAYLFRFLDAYDFASNDTDYVREENKSIINASVLGKVFEKINGYKDGSIFTPAFITMYMCRQSIRLAVVKKFNDELSENGGQLFGSFDDLKSYVSGVYRTVEILKFNKIVNSLKICDPAVGSGHFLVSALNEIIAIKSELGILCDHQGVKLGDVTVDVFEDDLRIYSRLTEDNFKYSLKNAKHDPFVQRIQKTIFHEKQTIIENCLFGVDINPNSVKICSLRLWIELLKSAYYKEETGFKELETLPNLDINIKCGNSLLSRFALDSDLSKALKSIKYDISAYRGFVNDYKNEKSREVKKGLVAVIDSIKSDFRINIDDPLKLKISKARGELTNLTSELNSNQQWGEKTPRDLKKKLELATQKLTKLENERDAIINNSTFRKAFEWRFEFPEVLSNNGDFQGFDLIIGNPPYIKEDANKSAFNGLHQLECYQGKMDIWYLFGALGLKLLKHNSYLCFIATNNWVTNAGASNFRNIMIKNSQIIELKDFGSFMVFDRASIQTMVMLFKNTSGIDNYTFDYGRLDGDKRTIDDVSIFLSGKTGEGIYYLNPVIEKEKLISKTLTFNSDLNLRILDKIKSKHNFFIRSNENNEQNLKSEFGNGIDVMQDVVSIASSERMNGNAKVGEGIFVLSQAEVEKKNFTKKESEILKPYYTAKQLTKFYGNPKNTHWVIYTKSDINKLDAKTGKPQIDSYPNIKTHLDFYQPIITSAFKPYGLNRSRDQYLFEGEKIMVQRKCPKEPIFTYTNFDCYVSRAFLIIQSDRINLKYLTGLLNSTLIAFWLRKKGKLQGNAYQLDKEPLLEIPIFKPQNKETKKVASLVEKIIAQKQAGKDSSENERKLDELIYELYEISADEKAVIEASLG